jgi:hypothetical protein
MLPVLKDEHHRPHKKHNPEKLAKHLVHKTQDEDKQNRAANMNGQSRETGNIWYTRHKTKTIKPFFIAPQF